MFVALGQLAKGDLCMQRTSHEVVISLTSYKRNCAMFVALGNKQQGTYRCTEIFISGRWLESCPVYDRVYHKGCDLIWNEPEESSAAVPNIKTRDSQYASHEKRTYDVSRIS